MALTCPSVADFISLFYQLYLSCTPLGPTVRQQVRAFISSLRTSLLASNRLDLSVQIDSIELSFCCRFYFRFFTFLTSCAASNTQERLAAFVNALMTPFLVRY